MLTTWPWPGEGSTGEEFALICEGGGAARLLIVPALFDEANKLRRFTVDAMRRLAAAGVTTILPDLPGSVTPVWALLQERVH